MFRARNLARQGKRRNGRWERGTVDNQQLLNSGAWYELMKKAGLVIDVAVRAAALGPEFGYFVDQPAKVGRGYWWRNARPVCPPGPRRITSASSGECLFPRHFSACAIRDDDLVDIWTENAVGVGADEVAEPPCRTLSLKLAEWVRAVHL